MIVSTNLMACPKDMVPQNFEMNGLTYMYKVIQELEQVNLVAEAITCDDDHKVAYLSPEDFDDQNTQMLISTNIVDFLKENNLLNSQNIDNEQLDTMVETESLETTRV
jgi:hypothetical protein